MRLCQEEIMKIKDGFILRDVGEKSCLLKDERKRGHGKEKHKYLQWVDRRVFRESRHYA